MNTIAKVLEFHEAFGCAIGERPRIEGCRAHPALYSGLALLERARDCLRKGAASGDLACQRMSLVTEEAAELCDALHCANAVAALDALVDLRYVLDGTVIAFGFHSKHEYVGEDWERPTPTIFDVSFDRVHAANMAKLHDGKAVHNETGKIVKPPGWVAPDLSDLVV